MPRGRGVRGAQPCSCVQCTDLCCLSFHWWNLCRQEGIPFFIRWLLFRQAAKHEKKVWQPFERECLQASPSA